MFTFCYNSLITRIITRIKRQPHKMVKHTQTILYKISDCWFRDTFNFDFLKKGRGLVSTPYFVYTIFSFYTIFQKKIFSCYVLLPHQISMSGCFYQCLLEILGNMDIAIICFPVHEIINFEINFSFLIKPFFCFTKKKGLKFKYFKELNLFIISVARNFVIDGFSVPYRLDGNCLGGNLILFVREDIQSDLLTIEKKTI